jgi:hypothetical protein
LDLSGDISGSKRELSLLKGRLPLFTEPPRGRLSGKLARWGHFTLGCLLEAARYLAERGVRIVGVVDYLSVGGFGKTASRLTRHSSEPARGLSKVCIYRG